MKREAREITPADVEAYCLARQTIFLGQWLKSMALWPDYQTRLFRKTAGRYEDLAVHADVVVPGQVGTLQNFLVHNSTPTLSKQVGLLDRYSRYQAEELARRGAHFHWIDVTLRPVAIFLYRYFWQRGFTEGLRGLFVAFHAMAFSFFTHSKLWEREWRASQRR